MRDQPCRAIVVFKVEEIDYVDQYGFKHRAKVRGETRTLTVTDRTETFEYYHERIPCKVAVDGDGLEYVEVAITDFGPSSKLWSARDKSGPWYQSYSGKLGSECATMPVHHSALPPPSPDGWMGVVNGHLLGTVYNTEAEALTNAEMWANSGRAHGT